MTLVGFAHAPSFLRARPQRVHLTVLTYLSAATSYGDIPLGLSLATVYIEYPPNPRQ